MARKKAPNLLANRTASVAIHRNGLSIEVANVPADDAAIVAAELLRAMRALVKAGFDELVQDAGSLHSAALGDAPDDDDGEEWNEPAHAHDRRPLGFT